MNQIGSMTNGNTLVLLFLTFPLVFADHGLLRLKWSSFVCGGSKIGQIWKFSRQFFLN